MKTQQIKEFLDSCSEAYYNGSPIISDEAFDKLAESVDYTKVGFDEPFAEVEHMYRMYSLQKFYEGEKTNKPLKDYKTDDIIASTKFDGAAISILYIQGKLTRVLTRGDGIKGKLITNKFLGRNDLIPQEIRTNHDIVQITGEVVAPKEIENSRNYAAGSLNLKSVEEFATRGLTFLAYSIDPYTITETFDQTISTLRRWGFSTVKDKEVENIFPNDGLVFRLNSNREFHKLGFTSKHPKGSYALKERAEHVETTLLDVEWNTGKSGKVTPVAILEPIYIGDALISRATLNNVGFIEALDLNIGDTVAIIRAGEIIPCVCHKVDS